MNLFLLRYNNYYNRIVKREANLRDYQQYAIGNAIQNVNFIPGDFIDTEQIVNWNDVDPDYLIAVEDNVINSRWFVVSTYRTRKGQLHLSLHRDLIADYYDNLLTAPCFIEKATIANINDPAIFNKETLSVNQIKQAEYLLQDNTKMAWVVGYIPRDYAGGELRVPTSKGDGSQSYTLDSLSDYKYYQYSSIDPDKQPFISNPYNITYHVNFTHVKPSQAGNIPFYISAAMDDQGNYAGDVRYDSGDFPYTWSTPSVTASYSDIFVRFRNDKDKVDELNSYRSAYLIGNTAADTENFKAEDGKIIKVMVDQSTAVYYRIHVNTLKHDNNISYFIQKHDINVGSAMYNVLHSNTQPQWFSGTPNNSTFQIHALTTQYEISFELLADDTLYVKIPAADERYHLSDSPYDMFCIPYPMSSATVHKDAGVYIDTIEKSAAFSVATQFAAAVGSAAVYDVQLLPYCPFQTIGTGDGNLDISTLNDCPIYKLKEGETQPAAGAKPVSTILFATSSQFSFNIYFDIARGEDVLEKKLLSETQVWRLCSPNYNGIFEFDPQKNNGIQFFNVDCNYKPFNPYIHINFDFNGLYGSDFNDARGLICGGDFSLPQITSAWANYELQNKNYQQMFDRQIQSMDLHNSIQQRNDIINAAVGTLSGGIAGAKAGAMTGNPYGAVVGAAVGTVASGIGGAVDIWDNNRLRNDALDYKKDMFGYQLQNIQALPYGLAKTTAITANNKIFPFLERYGCTDIEKQAIKDKLKYNGMTIMRIGYIEEFLNFTTRNYIKARLIRCEDIDEDFHIINAIADELYKGVFI